MFHLLLSSTNTKLSILLNYWKNEGLLLDLAVDIFIAPVLLGRGILSDCNVPITAIGVGGFMSTKFHIYGDESINGDHIVYGLVIVPVEIIELAENTLGNVKEKFKSSRLARFHCREVFHKEARRKTGWAHLSDKQAFDLALAITTSLAGKGLMTAVGHVVKAANMPDIPGVGGLPPTLIQHPKQLIPFAYQAAIGPLNFDTKYAKQCKLWIDPNKDVVIWHGMGRQVGRLLKTNIVDVGDKTIENVMIPENLESKCVPTLLELADLLAYCSCRVLANSKIRKTRYSDRVVEAIYKSMNPEVRRFNLVDPSQTKESQFVNFMWVGNK